MWYNLFLLASILTSFLESMSITSKIIYQSMHGNDQALEAAIEIPDLTSNVSRYLSDLPNFSKFTKTISEKKCMEYVYEMLKRQENKNLEYSGSQDVDIINGKVVHEAEFPHMGALGWWSWAKNGWKQLDFLCGASLISDSFMLTAAHCRYSDRTNLVQTAPYLVRLGTRYLKNSPHEMAKDIRIRNFIRHPSYDPLPKHFDIALVELDERVHFTKFIQPACLPSRRNYGSTDKISLIATGWGSVRARRNGYAMSNELRSVKVHVIDRTKCDELLQKYTNRHWMGLQPHQMCAGELDGSADTCEGDSGGPLQYLLVNTTSEGNIHRIMSVTSYGKSGCATADAPGIYTDVSYYYIIKWIESIVWPGGE